MGKQWLRSRKQKLTAVGIRCADHVTNAIRKSWYFLRRQAVVAGSVQFACGLQDTEFCYKLYASFAHGAYSECIVGVSSLSFPMFNLLIYLSESVCIQYSVSAIKMLIERNFGSYHYSTRINTTLHEVLIELARRLKSFYTVCYRNVTGIYKFYLKHFSTKQGEQIYNSFVSAA